MRMLFLALLGWAAYRIIEENRHDRAILLPPPEGATKRIKRRGTENE